jgi:hypothetical protein
MKNEPEDLGSTKSETPAARFSGTSPDPCDQNPFPQTDARHEVWGNATLAAEEELARFHVKLLEKRCTTPTELVAQCINKCIGTFDIWAHRGLSVVWGYANVSYYDRWLRDYAEVWFKTVEALPFMDDLSLAELRVLLTQRIEYWKAEARSFVSRQKAAGLIPEHKAAAAGNAEASGESMSQPSDSLPDEEVASAAERRAALEAYKRECREAGVKVTNPMIAKAADPNWNDRTPVEKWVKAKDPRYNTLPVDRKIRAVLRTKPHIPPN